MPSSRHILVINTSAYGEVLPTLDVVAELVRREHRVTYVTAGGPAAAVAATGATVLEYPTRLPEVDLSTLDTPEGAPWVPIVTLRESEEILRAVLGAYGGERPDLILYDATVYHAGRILCRKWGVPGVMSCPFLVSNERFSLLEHMVELAGVRHPRNHPGLVRFHRALVDLLVAHGQSDVALAEFAATPAELHLAYHPRSFQHRGETFDDRWVFIGPATERRLAEPVWQPPGDGRPIVVVSLGTSHHRRGGFFRTCLDAFADQPWHVVLAVYDEVAAAELSPVPPNVELHRWLPMFSVLEHADVFVCHGGMGSVMTAMYRATPVVAVPRSPESMANARRVDRLGLGRELNADRLTTAQLCQTVREVAADEDIHERVRQMRRELIAAGGGRRGADAIESYMDREDLA
ncbi:MAG TPA: macrolide family glycosyltransferase [Actinophytocola sp.]|uniref:macrolide family glycosyltransferase n=1 Tax=Actinophytocola sp. TaxID=1872138 RepID=UPI002DB7427C|nr:macrolide family glycosyltransferase [Actinophytocola sp.]HEU5471634.1 macrolide family glycosyltransferase [Actinophytocola sp.]